ncbi:MAG TPA: penicillin-binding transpeptidase domain-containing protein [Verrucomicrobiae bacterium]|nr:penicillin-binding transpeptidase domain-containing protein [Verrucomicrobiae bacterium]
MWRARRKKVGARLGRSGLWLACAAGLCGGWVRGERYVVLETIGGGGAEIVAGDAALADVAACPASTFKLVIALAVLEGGIAAPSERHVCHDVPGGNGRREIDMREAMRCSSNEYFLWLAGRLRPEKIVGWAVRTRFVDGVVAGDWLGGDASAVVRGGVLKVTARRLHGFTVRLMRGGLASTPEVQLMLEDVMSWPCPDPGAKVFGKTGAWGGAAWFTGFVERGGARKATTVLVPYRVPDWRPARERAIGLFFERTGVARPSG